VACFAFSTPAHAAQTVPYRINFQGRITNTSGTILSNGSYNMKFRIYNASSGGTLMWSEDRLVASSQSVSVTNGLFSVQLNEVANTMTPALFANQDLYLEVELPTLATATTSSPSWTEGAMSRTKLASASYAFNSDTLDGLDSAAFGQLSTANAFTNTNSITTSNASALVVNSGSSNILSVDTTGTGKVTIGTVDSNGTVLVLDSNASDPTGTTGGMYYNSTNAKFRCYYASAWSDCSTTLSLNNLTTTSINQSLTANATNTLDLGTSTVKWRTGYFGTSLVTPAVRPVADSSTAFQIQNAAGSSTYLNLNTTSGAIEIGSSALAGKLAISDGSSNFITLNASASAADYTLSIPTITANDTLCLLTNANCTTSLQTAYNISAGGSTPEIKVNSTKGGVSIQDADSTIGGLLFSVNQSNAVGIGTAILSINSTGVVSLGISGQATTLSGDVTASGVFSSTGATALFKPSSSAANAFQIQNSSALAFLSADTSATIVRIGSSSTADATVQLVLDYATTDPTGVNGGEYYNSTNNRFRCYENSAWRNCTTPVVSNVSTATQALTAGTDTYVTGSAVTLPSSGLTGPSGSLTNGTLVTWRIYASKTAAGTAASSIILRVGTNGTTADAQRCSTFSTGTPTAVVDGATITITAYATAGGATATLNCSMTLTHQLPATGFANTPITQSYSTATSFASNTAGTKMGLSFNAGTSSVITIQKVEVTATNL
jgi:hypothetical protein